MSPAPDALGCAQQAEPKPKSSQGQAKAVRFATEIPSIDARMMLFGNSFRFPFRQVLPGSMAVGKPCEATGGNRRRGAGISAGIAGQDREVDFAALNVSMRPGFALSGNCNALGR